MVEREWDDPNWSIGDTLTAQQFADHVTEGHFPSDELQFTITTDGKPAFVDPQNGDAEILTYDRSAGTWTLNTLNATTEVTSPSVTTDALEANNLVGADVENATSDTVPTSQGNGSLAMRSVDHINIIETGPFGQSAEDNWSTESPVNTARVDHAVAVIGGLIYIYGGRDSGFNTISSTESYDPDTDTWTTVASLNTARDNLGGSATETHAYAVGGDGTNNNPLNAVEEYDPDTDTWTTVASLTTERRYCASAELNGSIYAIAGEDSGNNILTSVEEYDPDTDTWTTVASLNTARERLGATSNSSNVYVVGGGNSSTSFLSGIEEYDQSGDSWTSVNSLDTGRTNPTTVSVDDKIISCGGDGSSGALSSVEIYDPTVDALSDGATLPQGRQGADGALINGRIYNIAGADDSFTVLSSVISNVPFTIPQQVYSATGDALVACDDANAIIENTTTGRRSNPNLARDGEDIAFATDTTARIYRTEES